MGQRLTADVLPWLIPKPPPGSTNERLLAAVVAERRRRDQHRMAGEAAATRTWVEAQDTTRSPNPYAVPDNPAAQPPPHSGPADGGFRAPS
jgi:hypothetical protein